MPLNPVGAFIVGAGIGATQGAAVRAGKKRRREADAVVTMATDFAKTGNTSGLEATKQSITKYQGKDVYDRLMNQAIMTRRTHEALTGEYSMTGEPPPVPPAAQTALGGLQREPEFLESPIVPPGAQAPAPAMTTREQPPRFRVTRFTPGSTAPITYEPVSDEDVQSITDTINTYQMLSQSGIDPQNAWYQTLNTIANKYGSLPSSERLRDIKPDIEAEYDKLFNSGMLILTADERMKNLLTPEQQAVNDEFNRRIRLQYPNLSEAALKNLRTTVAAQSLGLQMGGHVPDYARDLVYGKKDIPISPEVERTAYKIFQKTAEELSDAEIAAAQQVYDYEEVERTKTEEKARTKARKRAEFEVAHEKPITPEDLAKYGIQHARTYKELAEQGMRLLGDSERKELSSLVAVQDATMELITLGNGVLSETKAREWLEGRGLEVTAKNIEKAMEPLWAEKNDKASRFAQKAYLMGQATLGTPVGVRYENYLAAHKSVTKVFNSISEPGASRFSDIDAELAREWLAQLSGVIPPGKAMALDRQHRLTGLLQKRMETVMQGGLIQTQPPLEPKQQRGSGEYGVGEIHEDAQGNRAVYKGKDEQGEDIWQMIPVQ